MLYILDPKPMAHRRSYGVLVAAMLLGATFSIFFAYGLILLNAMPY